MTNVTIIGTGSMAQAIGGLLADGGSSVAYLSHDEVGRAPITGEVVVLAVPYPAINGIVDAYRDQLGGKVVVDISNPLDFATFDSLVVPVGSSAAAELQTSLPDSSVLKAFNTTFAGTLVAKVGRKVVDIQADMRGADLTAHLLGMFSDVSGRLCRVCSGVFNASFQRAFNGGNSFNS